MVWLLRARQPAGSPRTPKTCCSFTASTGRRLRTVNRDATMGDGTDSAVYPGPSNATSKRAACRTNRWTFGPMASPSAPRTRSKMCPSSSGGTAVGTSSGGYVDAGNRTNSPLLNSFDQRRYSRHRGNDGQLRRWPRRTTSGGADLSAGVHCGDSQRHVLGCRSSSSCCGGAGAERRPSRLSPPTMRPCPRCVKDSCGSHHLLSTAPNRSASPPFPPRRRQARDRHRPQL